VADSLDFPLTDPISALVQRLSDFFASHGVAAYATGGFVRDVLLGRPVKDLDLALSGDPLHISPALAAAFAGNSFPLDEERRLVRVMLPGEGVHLDLQPLRGSIHEDLATRDFTIDAMAAELAEAASGSVSLIDPLGGLADLAAGLVRAVSEANLLDDPLRLLRGVRLATTLSFEIEPATAEMIRRHAPLAAGAAKERQRDELLLILASPRAAAGLRLMDSLGLLSPVLPEMDVARGVSQPKEHQWDVFNHSIEAVAAMEMLLAPAQPAGPRDRWLWRELWTQLSWWPEARTCFSQERAALLKLACLLHDIGKPETRTFQADGRMRFFGHAEAGARIAGKLMRRLRFPSRAVAHVTAMVHAHMRPLQMAQQGAPTDRAIYRFFRDTADAGVDTLFLSLADHLAAVGPRVTREGWRRHVAIVSYILRRRFEHEEMIAPPRLVRGDELMAELDVPAGPELGALLERIREAQAAGTVRDRDDALRFARAYLERPAPSG